MECPDLLGQYLTQLFFKENGTLVNICSPVEKENARLPDSILKLEDIDELIIDYVNYYDIYIYQGKQNKKIFYNLHFNTDEPITLYNKDKRCDCGWTILNETNN